MNNSETDRRHALRHRQRLRIGYITPRLSNQHGLAIWRGMVETARLHDVDLLCFPGGEVEHPDDAGRAGTARNAIYDLVDRASLDGLVVWGSSLAYYAGIEATRAFLRRFEPLPLVSIGVALPGIPGVVLDSYGGLAAALSHLIEVHGRRRIAFIRGPVTHREAGERYRAYCDTLAAYGIPFDPDLVSPPYLWVRADGAELTANGAEAVRLFVEERRVAFDALVACSDTFALGAVPALEARGLRVPEQVSVVGFDDRPACRVLAPPLTTVKISMVERGRRALSMLLARLAGEDAPAEVTLPAQLVVRRSCGCFEPAVVDAGGPLPPTPSPDCDQERGRQGRAFPTPAASPSLGRSQERGPGGEVALLDAFLAALTGEGDFLATLDAALRRTLSAGGDVDAWQAVVSNLRARLPDLLAHQPGQQAQAEALLHQARVLIGEHVWRAEAAADQQARAQFDRLHALSRALTLAVDVPELMDLLHRELPEMGIGACAVALYDDPHAPAVACRLVLAYDEHGRLALPSEGEAWPAPALASGALLARPLPAGVAADSPHCIVVEPLNCRDEPLGFIMLDGSRGEGQIYHVLQEQIGSALKGVLLLQENVRLYRTALAAQQTAQEKQRLAEEADRLKSRFLSMVSHELRTPLILLEGLSEMMLREGAGTLPGGSSRPPLPEPYRQDLARISATAQQLGGLVRDVLDLARSQVGQLRLTTRPVQLTAVLQPTLLLGEQMARSKGLDWRVEIPVEAGRALPQVCVDAARLQEVTLNLISNAVKFTAQGEVCVRITAADDGVMVSVSDTGVGVPLDEQEAIFDEFRQSERTAARGFGGLGVGLAICREIVHMHGGQIGVRSSGALDGGSTFFYTLPLFERNQVSGLERNQVSGRNLVSTATDETVVLLTEHATGGELLRTHLLAQGFDAALLAVEAREDWLGDLLALRPAAVVLDLQPTWARGWQLFDVLKQSAATQDIPVLLYSLLAEENGAHEGMAHEGVAHAVVGQDAAGGVLALDYVAKPMGPGALAHALQNLGLAEQHDSTDAILIADDDPAVRELHAAIVAERFPACRLLTAANGRAALDLLQGGERPLFILLDLMMPELDGIGVLDALQADARWRDIPVIVLTAQRLTEADMGHLSRGVAGILSKGMLTAEETLAQVDKALARVMHVGKARPGSEAQRLARKVMAYIHTHYAEDIGREEMAAYAGISVRHLTRCFAEEAGMSPADYLNRFRIAQARRLLDEGRLNITEVMAAVGFADSSYFSRIFRREVGMSPSAYRGQA